MAAKNNALNKPVNLSPELEAVCGKGPLSRAQVADHLDRHIDPGVAGNRQRIVVPGDAGEIDAAIACPVTGRNGSDANRTTAAQRERLAVLPQQLDRAGAYGTQTGDADVERPAHGLAARCRTPPAFSGRRSPPRFQSVMVRNQDADWGTVARMRPTAAGPSRSFLLGDRGESRRVRSVQ